MTPFYYKGDVIETAVQGMGLRDVAPFDPEKKVLGLPSQAGDLVRKSVGEFVDEVSRDTPAPGGGSIAALALCLEAARCGNDVMITDAGVGALVALAGERGAAYNARINLKSIKDAEYVKRTGIEIASLVEESRKIAGLVEHEVTRVIGQS